MALIDVTPGPSCKEAGLAIRDAIELLSGKWKVCILQQLSGRPFRFKCLRAAVQGISPKVLAKELQELEMHQLVTRTVCKTKPISVEYALNDHAEHVRKVLEALLAFGITHRNKIKETWRPIASS